MDKPAIKKYAVWARTELIARVKARAALYGIAENGSAPADAAEINGRVLTDAERRQRRALLAKIAASDYGQVMEEAAYTWFNRFCALRFMEVNNYLPSRVRVFTDEENRFKPQILTEAIRLELDGLDQQRVYALKEANDDEALFKYLLITQCNALNAVLPGMFQKINDYTELLFPDHLLREGSAAERMIAMIPEDDWRDQVQIIGWLYQYYNTEPKDKVFENLKKNIKISKENIPAATQLFTPDWIVRYMVENSLGRMFISSQRLVDSSQNEEERIAKEKELAEQMGWRYYLPEAAQTPEVRAQLTANHDPLTTTKTIDPCMGSGHILCYLFDVLVQIYEAQGYSRRDAAALILQNDLWGLDIDERAAQLAYFSVMMKARQYDRRIFTRGLHPHVYAIAESNGIDRALLACFGADLPDADRRRALAQMNALLDRLHDAKEYGSILQAEPLDWALLRAFAADAAPQMIANADDLEQVQTRLNELIDTGEALAQKYGVVATNPPYMGGSGMDAKLSDFVKKNYPDSKSDLFAVFIEHCAQMLAKDGYQAMITQHAWMFLSSFEKLRTKMMLTDTVNMVHLGARAFEEIGGEVVQTTSFVRTNRRTPNYKATYCRLIEPTTQQGKEDLFLSGENRYFAQQDNFSKIPGSPVAYWVSENFIDCFDNSCISDYGSPVEGIKTGENDVYLKMWFEICNLYIAKLNKYDPSVHRYCFTTKGGNFRKWYGNIEYVMLWKNNGEALKKSPKSSFYKDVFNSMEASTWTYMTSGSMSFRYLGKGYFYNNKGPAVFTTDKETALQITGYLNSVVGNEIQNFLNPTLTILPGNIRAIPFSDEIKKQSEILSLVCENVDMSKTDWDSFETSWDFKKHPLV